MMISSVGRTGGASERRALFHLFTTCMRIDMHPDEAPRFGIDIERPIRRHYG